VYDAVATDAAVDPNSPDGVLLRYQLINEKERKKDSARGRWKERYFKMEVEYLFKSLQRIY
jgi:hypothetical protein